MGEQILASLLEDFSLFFAKLLDFPFNKELCNWELCTFLYQAKPTGGFFNQQYDFSLFRRFSLIFHMIRNFDPFYSRSNFEILSLSSNFLFRFTYYINRYSHLYIIQSSTHSFMAFIHYILRYMS